MNKRAVEPKNKLFIANAPQTLLIRELFRMSFASDTVKKKMQPAIDLHFLAHQAAI
jgi:hypothetical protein